MQIAKQKLNLFFESRRNFLKGTAVAVGRAAVTKGVFSGITPEIVASDEFTTTPDNLEFYPPLDILMAEYIEKNREILERR